MRPSSTPTMSTMTTRHFHHKEWWWCTLSVTAARIVQSLAMFITTTVLTPSCPTRCLMCCAVRWVISLAPHSLSHTRKICQCMSLSNHLISSHLISSHLISSHFSLSHHPFTGSSMWTALHVPMMEVTSPLMIVCCMTAIGTLMMGQGITIRSCRSNAMAAVSHSSPPQ